MFEHLAHHFRSHGLPADVRTHLLLYESLDRGLIHRFGDLYLVLKGLLVKDQRHHAPFLTAFYSYFLDVDVKNLAEFNRKIAESEAFKDWKGKRSEGDERGEELIDRFLDELHESEYDFEKRTVLDKLAQLNTTETAPQEKEEGEIQRTKQDEAYNYSKISDQELNDRLQDLKDTQKLNHSGGKQWIGQGGKSPFGQQGAAEDGIRMGGNSAGRMARRVLGNKNFYPVDYDATLSDNEVDVVLTLLRGIEEETSTKRLNIRATLREGARRGGLFLPEMHEVKEQKVEIILMVDNGGLSMLPHVKRVQQMFSKLKRRFAEDLKTYYFHNTIYDGAYSDAQRNTLVPVSKICSYSKKRVVFVLGDADMSPSELDQQSVEDWRKIRRKYPRSVWLNPLKPGSWSGSQTVNQLRRVFPMLPLTPAGIEKAVGRLREN